MWKNTLYYFDGNFLKRHLKRNGGSIKQGYPKKHLTRKGGKRVYKGQLTNNSQLQDKLNTKKPLKFLLHTQKRKTKINKLQQEHKPPEAKKVAPCQILLPIPTEPHPSTSWPRKTANGGSWYAQDSNHRSCSQNHSSPQSSQTQAHKDRKRTSPQQAISRAPTPFIGRASRNVKSP